jgi:hypothetical protein
MRALTVFAEVGIAVFMCLAAQAVDHIVSGTVTKVDHAAKTVTVKTAAGTEVTVKVTEKTSVKAADSTAKATAESVKEGDHLVVHYSIDAGQKTAVAMKSTGNATAKAVQGTIVGMDKAGKTVTVLTADGTKETYHFAEDGVLNSGKATGKAGETMGKATTKAGEATAEGVTKGSKVTVHYTDQAGKKIAHGFEHIF